MDLIVWSLWLRTPVVPQPSWLVWLPAKAIGSGGCVNTQRGKSSPGPGNTQEPTKRAIQQTVEAEENCKKQCSANYTNPYHTMINPYSRSSNPTHSQIIANTILANTNTHTHTHTSMSTGMRPHARSHQEAGRKAPALTNHKTPPKGVHAT